MVSYDDLPEDPFDRRTEIDRRIEGEIVKIVRRRRFLKRAALLTAFTLMLGGVATLLHRVTTQETTPDDHVATAVSARDQGDYHRAIEHLDLVLAVDPSRLGVRGLRAELALALGRGREAREHFLLASPDGKGTIVSLGLMRTDLLAGKFAAVAATATAALEHAPNEDLEVIIAQAHLGEGKLSVASAGLEKLLVRFSRHEEGLLTQAYALLAGGQTEAAALAHSLLAKIAPRVSTGLLAGEIALARGDAAGAHEAFSALDTHSHEHPEQPLGLARAALLTGDGAAARTALAQLKQPGPHARFLSAWAHTLDGADKEAETLVDDLLRAHPKHFDGRYLAAQLAHARSDHQTAAMHLEKLLDGRTDPYATVLAARLALATGQNERAARVLEPWARQTQMPGPVADLLRVVAAAVGDTATLERLESVDHRTLPKRAALWRCNVVAFTCERCSYVRVCR